MLAKTGGVGLAIAQSASTAGFLLCFILGTDGRVKRSWYHRPSNTRREIGA